MMLAARHTEHETAKAIKSLPPYIRDTQQHASSSIDSNAKSKPIIGNKPIAEFLFHIGTYPVLLYIHKCHLLYLHHYIQMEYQRTKDGNKQQIISKI